MEGQRVVDNTRRPWGWTRKHFPHFYQPSQTSLVPIEIIYASRLYRTALELIESRADIAYQLLISTVELLAAVTFQDYEPADHEKLKTHAALQQRAKEFGLGDEKAKQLVLEACKGERWLKKEV